MKMKKIHFSFETHKNPSHPRNLKFSPKKKTKQWLKKSLIARYRSYTMRFLLRAGLLHLLNQMKNISPYLTISKRMKEKMKMKKSKMKSSWKLMMNLMEVQAGVTWATARRVKQMKKGAKRRQAKGCLRLLRKSH